MSATAENFEFAQLYVESVRIVNFRGISECYIELEPQLTLIVGMNNAGKSRLLRAIGIGLGGVRVGIDDLTIGSSAPSMIDIVVAPLPPTSGSDDSFPSELGERMGPEVQTLREEPFIERFAWRTTIAPSNDGSGARTDVGLLNYDATREEWALRSSPASMRREQRELFSADLIETHRDLVDDLGRRSSPIRKVLNDLEIDESARADIEAELERLGSKVAAHSPAIDAVSKSLATLDEFVGGFGKPALRPLPTNLEELARATVHRPGLWWR